MEQDNEHLQDTLHEEDVGVRMQSFADTVIEDTSNEHNPTSNSINNSDKNTATTSNDKDLNDETSSATFENDVAVDAGDNGSDDIAADDNDDNGDWLIKLSKRNDGVTTQKRTNFDLLPGEYNIVLKGRLRRQFYFTRTMRCM